MRSGTIFYRRGERISFRCDPSLAVHSFLTLCCSHDSHLGADKMVGDTIKLSILRQGAEMDMTIRLGSRISLVPLHLHDKLPKYFVHAGPLSVQFRCCGSQALRFALRFGVHGVVAR